MLNAETVKILHQLTFCILLVLYMLLRLQSIMFVGHSVLNKTYQQVLRLCMFVEMCLVLLAAVKFQA